MFSSRDFPPLSQVMSPSAGAQDAPGAVQQSQVTDEALARQIRALLADVSEPSERPGQRRRREEEGDQEARGSGDQATRGSGGQAARGGVQAAQVRPMGPLRLRPLNTYNPAGYANWRLATKAAIVCRADDPMLDVYVGLIEDPRYSGEQMTAEVQESAGVRAIDRLLYSALLECIEGGRREPIIDELRTTVPFGSGCRALRCLDKKFGQAGARAKVAATAELLNLTAAGRGAKDLDTFLSRFRALVATAGHDNAGPAVQVEVLQRAAVGHPVLGPALMAWRQAGGMDPVVLREKIEDIVAEGLAGPRHGHSAATAWAALEHDALAAATENMPGSWAASQGCVNDWAAQAAPPTCPVQNWSAWAAAAAAARGFQPAADGEGPTCWECGKRGHRQRGCPERQRSGDAGKNRLDNIEETLNKLAAELRAVRMAARSGGSKK